MHLLAEPSTSRGETPTFEETTGDTSFDVDLSHPIHCGDTVYEAESTGNQFHPVHTSIDVPDMKGPNTSSEKYFKHQFIA